MDKVSDILAFIDQDDEPQPEEPKPTEEPKESKPIETEPIEDAKTYRSMLGKLRKLKKTDVFPCTVNVDKKAVVFNSLQELDAFKKTISKQRREYNKTTQSKRIKKSKLDLDKLPDVSDPEDMLTDEVDDDTKLLYKKTQAVGIQKKGKAAKKLPVTSKKETSEIYDYLKTNKALIKKLILSDDPDEFEQLTRDNIDNPELRERAVTHAQNTINNDNTWTRDALRTMIRHEMKQAQEEKHGLNPALFKRK